MDRLNFLNELKEILGYNPIFHDNEIMRIEIEPTSIKMDIKFLGTTANFFNKDSKYNNDILIKLNFIDIEEFNFDAKWFCNKAVSVIYDFNFIKNKEIIETSFTANCGAEGFIKAKSIELVK